MDRRTILSSSAVPSSLSYPRNGGYGLVSVTAKGTSTFELALLYCDGDEAPAMTTWTGGFPSATHMGFPLGYVAVALPFALGTAVVTVLIAACSAVVEVRQLAVGLVRFEATT